MRDHNNQECPDDQPPTPNPDAPIDALVEAFERQLTDASPNGDATTSIRLAAVLYGELLGRLGGSIDPSIFASVELLFASVGQLIQQYRAKKGGPVATPEDLVKLKELTEKLKSLGIETV